MQGTYFQKVFEVFKYRDHKKLYADYYMLYILYISYFVLLTKGNTSVKTSETSKKETYIVQKKKKE